MSDKTYALQNRTRPEVVERRKVLYDLYKRSPLPIDELMVNLGLYMRSGALARILFLNELYENILHLPGCIVEFGTWWVGMSLTPGDCVGISSVRSRCRESRKATQQL